MPGPVSFKSFPSALKRHPNKEGFACRGLWNPVEAASSSQPSDCSLKCLLSSAQAIYILGFGELLGLGADWGMSVVSGICHNLVLWDTQSRILLPRPPSCLTAPMTGGQISCSPGQRHPGAGPKWGDSHQEGCSCLLEGCWEVLVCQLSRPPVPPESQRSSLGVWVSEGCGPGFLAG